MKVDERDLAYTAGYFDGEGSVVVRYTTGGYNLSVTISNTYKPGLLVLQEQFGGGIARGDNKGSGYRQVWHWQLYGVTAYTFLEMILPYLREKSPQAKEAVEFYKLYGAHTYKRGVGRTAEEKTDQEARRLRISALKFVEYAA